MPTSGTSGRTVIPDSSGFDSHPSPHNMNFETYIRGLPVDCSEEERIEWINWQRQENSAVAKCSCGSTYVYTAEPLWVDLKDFYKMGPAGQVWRCLCGQQLYLLGKNIRLVAAHLK